MYVQSYYMRKNYLANDESGFFKKEKREAAVQNPMTGETARFPLFARRTLSGQGEPIVRFHASVAKSVLDRESG